MRRGLLLACLLLAVPPSAGAAEPYWSLLGVGQGETVNAAEFGAVAGSGEPPATFVNQRDLFNELLYEAPAVRTSELDRFFKPAPIDPPAEATTTTPRARVTISRDSYGVPYINGETRADTIWGVGWAAAEDRLFFMDVLRHTAQSRLTELAGPGEHNVNLEADVEQLSVTDYDAGDLSAMLERLGRSSSRGAQVVQDLRDYTAGINAYIAAARADPSLLPAEYPALGRSPLDWQLTDSVSILGLLNGYFGLGGGREAEVAMALREAAARFGRRDGAGVLADFRAADDPEAPVVTGRRFPFDDPGAPRRAAIAFLDRGSLEDFDRLEDDAATGTGGGTLLPRGFPLKRHASNAMVIPGAESKTGKPLFVAGPQVDFYSPAVFHEMAISGPGIRARGVGVPGVGPYALIGRGDGFVWSITTAQGDLADEFAEKLCEPDGSKPTLESDHYRYRGRCRPLTNRRREISWTPGPADYAANPAAQPARWIVRTQLSAHGPIVGRATVRGKPVAIAFNRSTYNHEAESALGFLTINGGVAGPREFMRAAGSVTGSYNFFYADDEHAAYVQAGLYPRRAPGTSPILPAWGTGRWDWRGTLPYRRLPKVVDPRRGYIISWNNKQAPGWRASDADWQYGPVHRSQRLEKRVRAAIRGRRKLDLGALVGIMGDAGTVDVRGQSVLPWLLRVIGRTDRPDVEALRTWLRDGAHRRDLDRDNVYDESYAVALMDAWWTPMVRAVFQPVLGRRLLDRIADINQIDYTPRQGPDTWYYGWMGYLQKDMRALVGRRIAEPPSRVYCGSGSRRRCRAILLRTLGAAAEEVPADVKVPATCDIADPPQCDQLDFIAAGAVETPPIPWQDRGTFQQAAEPGAG